MPTNPISTTLTNARTLINSSRRNLQLNVLRYPDDIDQIPHKILFRFVRRNTSSTDREFRITTTNTNQYLALPVPTNIRDDVNVSYSTDPIGLTGEVLSQMSNDLSSLSLSRMGEIFSNPSSMTNPSPALTSALTSGAVLQQSIGGTVALAARNIAGLQVDPRQINRSVALGLGQIVNPFSTAIFQGVNLRQFSFEWFFSPSSKKESENIEKIIKMIRVKSLPKIKPQSGGAFLEFPDEVEFSFLGMQNDTFSFPTSPCVIQSFSVDRSPTGNPVFFAGTGAPAFIAMYLSLVEIRPLVAQASTTNASENEVAVNPRLGS